MILEGLVTTLSGAGKMNVAPMGPKFIESELSFELRPFDTSTTYRNLQQTPCGVLHVTDNALLIAQTAIHQLPAEPPASPANKINGMILDDSCRWYEFNAKELVNDTPRKTFHCQIVAQGSKREFYGFNRGKHAIIEATILATRIEFIPVEEILTQYKRLETIVQKTGGKDEHLAFQILSRYVQQNQPPTQCQAGPNK